MSRFKYVSEFVELVDEETGAVTRTVVGRTVPFTEAEEEAADAEEADQATAAVAVVSARQIRLALLRIGLLSAATAWISNADEATRIEWEYATELRRDHPMWTPAASALGKTEADIDYLFSLAVTL